MGNSTQRFVLLYKMLESKLKEYGKGAVYEYETSLPEADADRLRICRQIRNYIQHHEDGETFLACTNEMCDFLDRLMQECNQEHSSRIKELRAVSIGEKLSDIEKIFLKSKRAWLPIVDSRMYFLGTLDLSSLIFMQARNSPTATLEKALESVSLETKTAVIKMEDVMDTNITSAIVVDDAGHYMGIIQD